MTTLTVIVDEAEAGTVAVFIGRGSLLYPFDFFAREPVLHFRRRCSSGLAFLASVPQRDCRNCCRRAQGLCGRFCDAIMEEQHAGQDCSEPAYEKTDADEDEVIHLSFFFKTQHFLGWQLRQKKLIERPAPSFIFSTSYRVSSTTRTWPCTRTTVPA